MASAATELEAIIMGSTKMFSQISGRLMEKTTRRMAGDNQGNIGKINGQMPKLCDTVIKSKSRHIYESRM